MQGDKFVSRVSCAPRQEAGQPRLSSEATPFSSVVEGIRSKDAESVKNFHDMFREGVRLLIGSGSDRPFLVENCLTAIVAGIQQGELADPQLLPEYICKLVRLRTDWQMSEAEGIGSSQGGASQLRELLDRCSLLETEMLCRYYVNRQTVGQICREMKVSDETLIALLRRVRAPFSVPGLSEASKRAPRPFSSAHHRSRRSGVS